METKYETEKKELLIQDQQLKLERTQIITIGLVIVLAFIALLILLWRRQTKLQEQRKLERHQHENQEKLTKTVISLQEKERSRFAQDLHDGFGQLITALKIQFEKLGQRNDGISELIQHMHDEIRNVSFALSPQVLVRDGLVQALKELSFRINRSNTISMSVQTTGLQRRLSSDLEITLYRICQEWINNVLKYSGATRMDVQLIEHTDEIVLMIEDNGKGFAIDALETGSGNGWKNIQSRVLILNGQVEVDSSPDRPGTTFTANIRL
jgi:two-component system NarL family sensor kinase